ncbi:hypothetical protein DIPPA_01055 [Diplonema papillatum]|nr:hypothetical protein DIPPA_01055 [Diplonema papillatum]
MHEEDRGSDWKLRLREQLRQASLGRVPDWRERLGQAEAYGADAPEDETASGRGDAAQRSPVSAQSRVYELKRQLSEERALRRLAEEELERLPLVPTADYYQQAARFSPGPFDPGEQSDILAQAAACVLTDVASPSPSPRQPATTRTFGLPDRDLSLQFHSRGNTAATKTTTPRQPPRPASGKPASPEPPSPPLVPKSCEYAAVKDRYPPGSRVQLHSLVKKPELNEKVGVVAAVARHASLGAVVRVDIAARDNRGGSPDGPAGGPAWWEASPHGVRTVSVRPQNVLLLQRRSPPPEGAAKRAASAPSAHGTAGPVLRGMAQKWERFNGKRVFVRSRAADETHGTVYHIDVESSSSSASSGAGARPRAKRGKTVHKLAVLAKNLDGLPPSAPPSPAAPPADGGAQAQGRVLRIGEQAVLCNLRMQKHLNGTHVTIKDYVPHPEHGLLAEVQAGPKDKPIKVMFQNLTTVETFLEYKDSRQFAGRDDGAAAQAPSALDRYHPGLTVAERRPAGPKQEEPECPQSEFAPRPSTDIPYRRVESHPLTEDDMSTFGFSPASSPTAYASESPGPNDDDKYTGKPVQGRTGRPESRRAYRGEAPVDVESLKDSLHALAARTADEAERAWPRGRRAVVFGLRRQAELNGQVVEVLRYRAAGAGGGVAAQVETDPARADPLWIRQENLAPWPAPGARAGSEVYDGTEKTVDVEAAKDLLAALRLRSAEEAEREWPRGRKAVIFGLTMEQGLNGKVAKILRYRTKSDGDVVAQVETDPSTDEPLWIRQKNLAPWPPPGNQRGRESDSRSPNSKSAHPEQYDGSEKRVDVESAKDLLTALRLQSAEEAEREWPRGRRVVIFGRSTETQLNGQVGRVLRYRTKSDGDVVAQVETDPETDEPLWIRQKNLAPWPPPGSRRGRESDSRSPNSKSVRREVYDGSEKTVDVESAKDLLTALRLRSAEEAEREWPRGRKAVIFGLTMEQGLNGKVAKILRYRTKSDGDVVAQVETDPSTDEPLWIRQKNLAPWPPPDNQRGREPASRSPNPRSAHPETYDGSEKTVNVESAKDLLTALRLRSAEEAEREWPRGRKAVIFGLTMEPELNGQVAKILRYRMKSDGDVVAQVETDTKTDEPLWIRQKNLAPWPPPGNQRGRESDSRSPNSKSAQRKKYDGTEKRVDVESVKDLLKALHLQSAAEGEREWPRGEKAVIFGLTMEQELNGQVAKILRYRMKSDGDVVAQVETDTKTDEPLWIRQKNLAPWPPPDDDDDDDDNDPAVQPQFSESDVYVDPDTIQERLRPFKAKTVDAASAQIPIGKKGILHGLTKQVECNGLIVTIVKYGFNGPEVIAQVEADPPRWIEPLWVFLRNISEWPPKPVDRSSSPSRNRIRGSTFSGRSQSPARRYRAILARTPCEAERKLPIGSDVALFGLKKQRQHNGAKATVLKYHTQAGEVIADVSLPHRKAPLHIRIANIAPWNPDLHVPAHQRVEPLPKADIPARTKGEGLDPWYDSLGDPTYETRVGSPSPSAILREAAKYAGVPVLGSHAGYSSDEDDDDDGANTRTRRDRVTFSDAGSPRSGRHLSRDSRSTVDGRSDHSRGRADARQGTHARNDYSNDRPGHQSRDSSYDPGHPANRSWGGGSPAATGRRSESSLRDGSPPHRELPPRGSSSPAAGGRASRHGTASLRMSRSASKSGSPQPPSPMLQRLRGTREERVYGERCALEAAKTVDPPGSTVGLRNLSDQPDLNLSTATVLRFIHHSEHGVVAHVQPKGHPSPVVVMLKNLVTATDLAELKRRASGRQAASPDAAPSALKDTRPHTHSVRGMSPPDVHRSDRLNFGARTASPGTPSRGRSIDRFDDRSQASYPRRNSEDKVVQRALSRDSPPSRSGTSHERTTDDAGLVWRPKERERNVSVTYVGGCDRLSGVPGAQLALSPRPSRKPEADAYSSRSGGTAAAAKRGPPARTARKPAAAASPPPPAARGPSPGRSRTPPPPATPAPAPRLSTGAHTRPDGSTPAPQRQLPSPAGSTPGPQKQFPLIPVDKPSRDDGEPNASKTRDPTSEAVCEPGMSHAEVQAGSTRVEKAVKSIPRDMAVQTSFKDSERAREVVHQTCRSLDETDSNSSAPGIPAAPDSCRSSPEPAHPTPPPRPGTSSQALQAPAGDASRQVLADDRFPTDHAPVSRETPSEPVPRRVSDARVQPHPGWFESLYQSTEPNEHAAPFVMRGQQHSDALGRLELASKDVGDARTDETVTPKRSMAARRQLQPPGDESGADVLDSSGDGNGLTCTGHASGPHQDDALASPTVPEAPLNPPTPSHHAEALASPTDQNAPLNPHTPTPSHHAEALASSTDQTAALHPRTPTPVRAGTPPGDLRMDPDREDVPLSARPRDLPSSVVDPREAAAAGGVVLTSASLLWHAERPPPAGGRRGSVSGDSRPEASPALEPTPLHSYQLSLQAQSSDGFAGEVVDDAKPASPSRSRGSARVAGRPNPPPAAGPRAHKARAARDRTTVQRAHSNPAFAASPGSRALDAGKRRTKSRGNLRLGEPNPRDAAEPPPTPPPEPAAPQVPSGEAASPARFESKLRMGDEVKIVGCPDKRVNGEFGVLVGMEGAACAVRLGPKAGAAARIVRLQREFLKLAFRVEFVDVNTTTRYRFFPHAGRVLVDADSQQFRYKNRYVLTAAQYLTQPYLLTLFLRPVDAPESAAQQYTATIPKEPAGALVFRLARLFSRCRIPTDLTLPSPGGYPPGAMVRVVGFSHTRFLNNLCGRISEKYACDVTDLFDNVPVELPHGVTPIRPENIEFL